MFKRRRSISFAQKSASLWKYEKASGLSKLKLCCAAVNEATSTNNAENLDECKFQIVAALLAALHQDKIRQEDWTSENDAGHFEAVTVGLPAFNKTLFFDIIKCCSLSKQLFQVKFHACQKLLLHILCDISMSHLRVLSFPVLHFTSLP